VTGSTYATPFLQNVGGQSAVPWQTGPYGQPGQFGPTGLEQFQQYGQGQQQPFGQGWYSFGGPSTGSQGTGMDQVVQGIQAIVSLLANAQQAISTVQLVAAQLPAYLATAPQQPYYQLPPQRQLPQFPRPFSMAW
jgi:hypothetical protein